MAEAKQIRTIKIVVDAPGVKSALDSISKSMGDLNKNTKTMASGFDALTNSTATFLGGLSIRTLTQFSDEIQSISNRLLAMTGSQEQANEIFSRLIDISRETNQSISSTAETYTRMSLAIKDAGISTETMLELTQTIANTFRLSGATAQEATNATIQLSQAFSLGVLRGQDLRSVMSQNVVLTQLLRREFGTELLKAAEKGLITVPKLMQILFDNMAKVNEQAKLMSATFEQSAVKALDAFKIKIGELNRSFGASSAFASAVEFLIKNMDLVVTILGILAVGTIPGLITSVYGLASALGIASVATLTFTGPWIALAGVLKAFGYDFGRLSTDITVGAHVMKKAFYEVSQSYNEMLSKVAFSADARSEYKKRAMDAEKLAKREELLAQVEIKKFRDGQAIAKAQEEEMDKNKRRLEDIQKALKNLSGNSTPAQEFAELNKQFLRDGDVARYNDELQRVQLYKLNYQFKEGKINLEQFQKGMRELDVKQITKEFNQGVISLNEYRRAIEESKIDELNEKFVSGKISAMQYHQEIVKIGDEFRPGSALYTGTTSYLESIGTVSSNVADAIKSTFSSLEDALVDFVTKGKFNFRDFTKAILDDLTRIIIRASIIRPIAQGILNFGGSGMETLPADNFSGGVQAANGYAFDKGIRKFASGGIVDSPTMFGYGNRKTGLMGEAGPEAIIPLRRGKGGELGVSASVTPVTINVINQSGSEVKQTETTGPNGEKTIDILITSKVKDGIMSGKYDGAMKAAYGLNRRGS